MAFHELVMYIGACALQGLSIIFGSVGVFCLYAYAVCYKPKYIIFAVACLMVASAVTLAMPGRRT
jgi:hypothetical protein